MIKMGITYFFLFFLSGIFLYAACGYNIPKYCCHNCESIGIEVMLESSCHLDQPSSCCAHEHASRNSFSETCDTGACDIIHLKVDNSVLSSAENRTAVASLHQIILYAKAIGFVFSEAPHTSTNTNPPEKPHLLTGRAVLCSISTLLI